MALSADRPPTETFDTDITSDRRAKPRIKTVYRLVKVYHDGDEGLAMCRNISDDGMMLELHMPLALNGRIEILFSPNVALNGRVTWLNGYKCGIAFDTKIDSVQLLGMTADEARAAGARMPRLQTSLPTKISVEGKLRPAIITDISLRGMKLACEASFRPGLEVTVIMDGGKELPAVVRWTRGKITGVMLSHPFPVEALGSVRKLGRT